MKTEQGYDFDTKCSHFWHVRLKNFKRDEKVCPKMLNTVIPNGSVTVLKLHAQSHKTQYRE